MLGMPCWPPSTPGLLPPLLFLTASVVGCWEAGTGLWKSWLSRGGGEPADASITILSKLMDETIIKLQREVKLNRIHVLIAFWIFFSSQLLRCRTDWAFLWGCWCWLHNVLLLKKEEKAWASLFSSLCSQSSSVVPCGSMLCLDSKSDLKYCPDAAREKKSLLQAPVVLRCPSLRGVCKCRTCNFLCALHPCGEEWGCWSCLACGDQQHGSIFPPYCMPGFWHWHPLASNLVKILFQLKKPPCSVCE